MEQDEFQFKPINEGLGFHKKKPFVKLDLDEDSNHALTLVKKPPQNEQNVDQSSKKLASLFEEKDPPQPHSVFQDQPLMPPITDTGIQFENESEIDKNVFGEHIAHNDIFSSITRPQSPPTQMTNSQSIPVSSGFTPTDLHPENSSQPHPNRIPTNSLSQNTATASNAYSASYSTQTSESLAKQNTLALGRQYVAPHIGALLLDSFAVVSLLCMFIVPLMLITQINTSNVLSNIQNDPALQISLTILFLSVLNFYLMTARSFFGSTLGEWACDMTLGSIEQKQSPIYPILVVWRCFIMTITGVVTLPFLGWITRMDILGKLTFIRLTRS